MNAGRAKLIPLVSDSWQANDAVEAEGTLYVGGAGQRWLVRTEKSTESSPDAPEYERYALTGATTMAPETLIAVRKRKGSFLFLGASGTVYGSTGPLDPFGVVRAPPEPLRAAALGRDAIVVITKRHKLLRSVDDGVTFSPVSMAATATMPLQLAANAAGELVVVSPPGKLFVSSDDGASLAPMAPLGLGPTSYARAADGALLLRGYSTSATKPPGLAAISIATGLLRRNAGGTLSLERTTKGASPLMRPMNDDERLEFGEAAQTGRAVFNELGYLEVHAGEDGLSVLVLANQKVTSGGGGKALPGSRDCELVAVAGASAHIVVECVRTFDTPKGARDDLLFFRSTDFGKTFTAEGSAVASPDGVRLVAVSSKGTIVATGINDGIMLRPLGQKAFAAASVPKGYVPQKLLITPDGDRVYAVATGPDDVGPALLSSRDGGKTFRASAAPIEHLDDTIHLAYDNGTFAAFVGGDPVTRSATRDDGATWDTRELSLGADWISMAGARGLATLGGEGFETLDFGVTWGAVPLPHGSPVGGTLPIACSSTGCLLGDVAIREGWELASGADVKPRTAPAARKNVHLPALECAVEGDEIEIGTVSEPELEPMAGVSWGALSESPTGALDVIGWPTQAKSITRVSLLAAPKEPSGVRRWSSDDGAIVLRAPRGDGKSMADVEVAWWVASTNKVHHAVLPKATTSLGKWGAPSAVAAIVPGFGLYVRPGNSTTPTLFLVREGGLVSKVAVKDPFPSWTRVFARRTAAGTVFVGPAREGLEQAVLFGILSDGGSLTTHAWGLWPRASSGAGREKPIRTELFVAGEHLALSASGDDLARTFVLPWRDGALDPPEPTALESALPTCASKGARIDVPWVTGFRTPITIKRGKATIYHATRATTVRVGSTSCARGILAGAVHATTNEWTVIPGDDPSHGFLFARSNKTHVLARLTCSTNSKANLATAFVNAPGF